VHTNKPACWLAIPANDSFPGSTCPIWGQKIVGQMTVKNSDNLSGFKALKLLHKNI
jgi:hypothetical protein